MQTLDVGEVAVIATQWWDANGEAVEPSDITLTITAPDGTVTTVLKAAMTGSESGAIVGILDVWEALVLADQAGAWRYTPVGIIDGSTVTQPEQVFLVGVVAEREGQSCEQWCTWEEVETCSTLDFSSVSSAVRSSILDVTTEILFDLTGRWYTGVCSTTRSLCYACRSCYPFRCGCTYRDEIDLGGRLPVRAVWGVVVDGVTIDQSLYTVVGQRYLTRTDSNTWPRQVDITDPTEFRASWAYGRLVPPGGRRAAALFAAEMAAACVGSECQLPARITSIVREGVTYPIIDSLSMVKEGRTGLYLADLWIEADRQGRRSRSGIFVPAAAGARRTP